MTQVGTVRAKPWTGNPRSKIPFPTKRMGRMSPPEQPAATACMRGNPGRRDKTGPW